MGGVVDSVTSAVGGLLPGFNKKQGDRAEDAAKEAARTQAQAQQNALNYLKERERLPQQYRESALGLLGGLYGLNQSSPVEGAPPRPTFQPAGQQSGMGMLGQVAGDAANQVRRQQYEQDLAEWEAQYGSGATGSGPSQQQALAQIQGNPLYQATLGNLPQQEQAILRNQSATGALRGGGTDLMLAQNQRNNQLQAYQSALGGLQGLANLPSNASQIAQGTANIGQTRAQGIVGAEQTRQAAQQAGFGNLMGLGQLGLSAFAAFCDPALKSNAKKIGEMDGYNIYSWDWNKEAANLDLYGKGYGPMADEIEKKEPERITRINGYKFVRPANGN